MSIPTLDLQLAESDRSEAVRQLLAALEEPGFLYLKNVKGYEPGTYKLLQNHNFICPVNCMRNLPLFGSSFIA